MWKWTPAARVTNQMSRPSPRGPCERTCATGQKEHNATAFTAVNRWATKAGDWWGGSSGGHRGAAHPRERWGNWCPLRLEWEMSPTVSGIEYLVPDWWSLGRLRKCGLGGVVCHWMQATRVQSFQESLLCAHSSRHEPSASCSRAEAHSRSTGLQCLRHVYSNWITEEWKTRKRPQYWTMIAVCLQQPPHPKRERKQNAKFGFFVLWGR